MLSIVEESHIRAGAMPGASSPHQTSVPPEPTADQQRAMEGIGAALGAVGVHLLHGVTGSGKTEVYLRLMERVLSVGGGAIVLVPEIALTPQTSERFVGRLGAARVAVLHSGLTAAQRHREGSRAAAGEARVVVGARSAVFAPVAGLSLIVVDEEHDTSYKQDRAPRYHARDVAIKRAHLEGACVVLGSATPSLESWSNAAKGRFRLWSLPTRAGGATLPRVEVVDMVQERRRRFEAGKDTTQHLLGPTLEEALSRTLSAGAQAILLLNRRGFSSYIACVSPSCGYIVSCADCDAHLVLHRDRRLPVGAEVRCHHCEARQKVPAACPACAGRLNFFSGGTQRLEQELARKFAPMGLVEGETFRRVDSDTMRSARDYFDVLGDFARGALRVLIGTQMLAKGLDFPGVRLVGVIDADTALHIPDFRSAERTFQLVSQVAGRAGRGAQPGLVIVQTMSPQNPAIVLAWQHRYTEFAAGELAIRVRSGLPPATRMARIVCKDESEARARRHAEDVASALRGEAARAKASLRGPDPCPLSRIAGEYRFAVEVIAPDASTLSADAAVAARAGSPFLTPALRSMLTRGAAVSAPTLPSQIPSPRITPPPLVAHRLAPTPTRTTSHHMSTIAAQHVGAPRTLEGARVVVMGLGNFGGGAGVARWLAQQGASVLLTDVQPEEALRASLAPLADYMAQGRITTALGGHNVADFTTCDMVVANPAVPKPWDNRYLRAARAAGIPITTEIRLVTERLPARERVIGITGSAGKSTTTAMISHMLARLGERVHTGGNIGGSLLNAVSDVSPADWVVLELSSAMLHWLGGGRGLGGRRDGRPPSGC